MKLHVCMSLLVLVLAFTSTVLTEEKTEGSSTPSSNGNSTEHSGTNGTDTQNTSSQNEASSTETSPTTTVPGSSGAETSDNTPISSNSTTITTAAATPPETTAIPPSSPGNTTESTKSSEATEASASESTTLNVTNSSSMTQPSTEEISSSTSAKSTLTASTTPAVTSAPQATDVVISETNLKLAADNFFVELNGSSHESLTLAVFNGTNAEEIWTSVFNSSTGFIKLPIDEADLETLSSVVVVALYQTKDYNNSLVENGLQDFTVYSMDPNATLAPKIRESLFNGPVTVVKRGLAQSQKLSLSRCGEKKNDPSQFVLLAESGGKTNNCSLTHNSTVWTLQLRGQKNICRESQEKLKEEVENQLISELNKHCQCGLTSLLVESNLTCARDLFLEFRVQGSYKGQVDRVVTAFTSYVSGGSSFRVNEQEFNVVNCTRDCKTPPHYPPDSGKSGNVSVTVAVVLSCIAVFLIILVSVILYMRGKRRGIIRQFRMTRLQEDDDMDDMDDFIGTGEPSFSSRSLR